MANARPLAAMRTSLLGSPVPALSSNFGSPDGCAPDLERMGGRSSRLDVKVNEILFQLAADPAPFQLPDLWHPARSLTDLLTAITALLARHQPHNVPLLHSAWTVHEVIAEEKPHPGVSQLRAWSIHTGGLGATLRVTLLFEDSATSTALSAGDSLTSLARPL